MEQIVFDRVVDVGYFANVELLLVHVVEVALELGPAAQHELPRLVVVQLDVEVLAVGDLLADESDKLAYVRVDATAHLDRIADGLERALQRVVVRRIDGEHVVATQRLVLGQVVAQLVFSLVLQIAER